MDGLRYANIGLVAGVATLIVGVLLFKDAGEGALRAVALISFIVMLVISHGLDERARRRKRRGQ